MALQKQYNIKVYTLTGVYEKTLSQSVIMSDISYSSQINGGQWELTVSLAVSVSSDIVAYNNIIKLYETDENNPVWILIYSWVVTQVKRVSSNWSDYIEVTVLGLATMLSNIYYYESGYTFSKNQEASETIKDIIDSFSYTYPWIITYNTSIESTGINSNISFDYTKCLDAINKAREVSSYWWTVDESWVFQYHPKTGWIWQVTHNLTFWHDIESITIDEDTEDIVNKYILEWSSGTVTADNLTSIWAYGLKELKETKTDISNIGTANSVASQYITQNKDPKRDIKIVVNSNYNLEIIKPGHLVTVKNYEYEIINLQIAKIEYNTENVSLQLEKITSFSQEISKI